MEARDVDKIISTFRTGASSYTPERIRKVYGAAADVESRIGLKKAIDVMDWMYDEKPYDYPEKKKDPRYKTYLTIEKIWQKYHKGADLADYAFLALLDMLHKLKAN